MVTTLTVASCPDFVTTFGAESRRSILILLLVLEACLYFEVSVGILSCLPSSFNLAEAKVCAQLFYFSSCCFPLSFLESSPMHACKVNQELGGELECEAQQLHLWPLCT